VSTAVLEKEKAVALKKPKKIRLDIGTKTALILSVALLLLMVVFPLLNILTRASEGTGREVFANIFESAVTRKIILNTIILGTVVATIGTIIGFFLAYAQVKLNFRGKKLLHVIALVPLITPPFAFATAVISLFGRSGIITRDLLGLTPTLYGLPGLTIVLSCSFFPVAYMFPLLCAEPGGDWVVAYEGCDDTSGWHAAGLRDGRPCAFDVPLCSVFLLFVCLFFFPVAHMFPSLSAEPGRDLVVAYDCCCDTSG
jgi:hypothetical protein